VLIHEKTFVYLTNVHYYLELDINLLSLSTLEDKDLEFDAKSKIITITNIRLNENNKIVLITNHEEVVYLLNQSANDLL
jgi:hypothetical protein